MKVAQQLITASAEFHTTAINSITPEHRAEQQGKSASGKAYKGLVVLFLGGGVDSFNMLVPHSNCGPDQDSHLYQEYLSVRGEQVGEVERAWGVGWYSLVGLADCLDS